MSEKAQVDARQQAIISVEGTSLKGWGNREEVRELAARMMKFHPAAVDVGESGMLAVAQLAILTGANPLATTGEIQVWSTSKWKKINNQWESTPLITVMLGIAYWRRKAREVDTPVWFVDYDDTNQTRKSYEPRPMTADERREYGIMEDDYAAICKCFRMSEHLKLLQSGVDWKTAQLMVLRTGTAVIAHEDTLIKRDTKYSKAGDQKPSPKGRTWAWMAAKRAEQDVYRLLSLINEGQAGASPSVIEIEEEAEVLDVNETFFD